MFLGSGMAMPLSWGEGLIGSWFGQTGVTVVSAVAVIRADGLVHCG
jgi:hypothetical protein